MAHTWQIKVFTPTGTVKQTYTQNSAGFGPEITWDIEPSGNCLTGSFQAIPSMVNIVPRDLVQIAVDGDDKFFGFVTNGPNKYSKRLATYNLEGNKKLLYDQVLDSWWFLPPDGGAGQKYSDGDLISHRLIVGALINLLPGYITSSSNLASLDSGNRGPIIAADYSLGDVLDGIIGSSYDEEFYVWGINADKQFFVKPIDAVTSIDFRSVTKHVEYSEENADDLCTSVRFVFSYPEGYDHPGTDATRWLSKYPDFYRTTSNPERAPIVYTYEDAAKIATYGKHTKIIPLVLTDSWLTYLTIPQIQAQYPSLDWNYFESSSENTWNQMSTQSGATGMTNLINAISTPGTSTYIRNPAQITSILVGFSMRVSSEEPGVDPYTSVLTALADRVIGYHIKATSKGSNRPLAWSTTVYNASPGNATEGVFAVFQSYRPPEDEGLTFEEVTIRYLYPKLSLLSWPVDPNKVTANGFKHGDYIALWNRLFARTISGPIVDGYIPANNLQIFEWFFLAFNEEALDGYAETFIVTPGEFPSMITVKGDLGIAHYADVGTDDGDIETEITRISHTLSPSMGYVTKYTTGRDDQRSNQFLTRMFNRDSNAKNTAFLTSTTRF